SDLYSYDLSILAASTDIGFEAGLGPMSVVAARMDPPQTTGGRGGEADVHGHSARPRAVAFRAPPRRLGRTACGRTQPSPTSHPRSEERRVGKGRRQRVREDA